MPWIGQVCAVIVRWSSAGVVSRETERYLPRLEILGGGCGRRSSAILLSCEYRPLGGVRVALWPPNLLF